MGRSEPVGGDQMRKALASFTAPLLFGVCNGFLSASSAHAQTNPTVIHEVKHDRSQPLRDLAVSAQSVPSAQQQATFPQRTGPAITTSHPEPFAQGPSVAPRPFPCGPTLPGPTTPHPY